MPTTRFNLDPDKLPVLTDEQRKRLDTMADETIEAGARDDADNPPLSAEELERMSSARLVKDARARTGLSQVAFAERFRINIGRLRDLEQGRVVADSAMVAYLTVIARNQRAVERALSA